MECYLCAVRKKNKIRILESVKVEDYAAEGKSIARVDGKVIFIEGAVPAILLMCSWAKAKKTGPKARLYVFMNMLQSVLLPFANILDCAEDANGKCYLTKSSLSTSSVKWSRT